MEPYYYQTLSKAEQSSYQAMQAGLQAFAPSFPVPLLENRALTDVFMKLRLDCPQLFYAGTFQYRYYPDSRNAELIPAYLLKRKDEGASEGAAVTRGKAGSPCGKVQR